MHAFCGKESFALIFRQRCKLSVHTTYCFHHHEIFPARFQGNYLAERHNSEQQHKYYRYTRQRIYVLNSYGLKHLVVRLHFTSTHATVWRANSPNDYSEARQTPAGSTSTRPSLIAHSTLSMSATRQLLHHQFISFIIGDPIAFTSVTRRAPTRLARLDDWTVQKLCTTNTLFSATFSLF
jgi:hypothetical protein